MVKLLQVNIHCKWQTNGAIFLYGTEEGYPISPNHWLPLLFQWHRSSFYGTQLNTMRFKYPTKELVSTAEGVVLDAYQALEFFGRKPFNQFVQWEWDAFTERLFAIAPIMLEAVQSEKWTPDFNRWQEGAFQWKVPDDVWEQLPEDLLVEPFVEITDVVVQKHHRLVPLDENTTERIPGYKPFLQQLRNGEPISGKEWIEYWFHEGVEGYLRKKPDMAEKWQTRKAILEKAIEEGQPLPRFFDEQSFKRWAGLTEDEIPYNFVLQLVEPQEDGDMWKLRAFLQDRETPETFVPLEQLPQRWEPYREDIVAMQEGICRLFPWLEKEFSESSFIKIKEELFEEEAWEFLTSASEVLLQLDIEILLPAWWEALKNANVRLKARVTSTDHSPSFVGLDALMDFEWRLSVNNVELSEEEFHQLLAEKRRLIRIGNEWVKLDPAFIKQIQDIMEKAEKEGMRVQDLIEQQLLYGEQDKDEGEIDEDNDPRIFSRIQIELHPRLRSFVDRLTHLDELPEQPVPKTLNGTLRPYQQKGMSWLYFLRQYRFGAVLADDMGLGKTVQLISYLLLVKEREPEAGPTLIICPTTVLGNWQKELARFSPGLDVYLHYGPDRAKGKEFEALLVNSGEKPDVVLTTYNLSHLDFDDLSSVPWGTIVLDEAQHIKNPETKQSRAIRKLKGQHHIALTGTPMENRLTELWAIFDFINKGYLGSLARFQQRFATPIEREKDQDKIQELRNLIKPFLLRRTKKDQEVALNLPEKLEQKEYCALTSEQAALYQQIIDDTFNEIARLTGFERKGYVLRLINQLKQLCDHPALFLKDFDDDRNWIERSAKLEKLVELLDVVIEQEESGLIFTQYIGMGKMIQTVLEKRYGIQVPFLRGSTPKKQRDTMVEQFQNRKFPILLLSLKAGGTGLNLTAANHVIHYDRWWNPAVENQATDRAYRIGQTKFVHVHKLITTGTLEEKIDEMLETKQALNDEIIQSDRWITDLSNDDLYQILRLD